MFRIKQTVICNTSNPLRGRKGEVLTTTQKDRPARAQSSHYFAMLLRSNKLLIYYFPFQVGLAKRAQQQMLLSLEKAFMDGPRLEISIAANEGYGL